MINNIRHFGIVVKDLDRALYFYRDLLGFKEIKRETLDKDFVKKLFGSNLKLTYIKLALIQDVNSTYPPLLELYYFKEECKQHDYFKYNHISLTVDNLDKLFDKLKSEGVGFLGEPTLDSNKKHKILFCRDYSGNLVELVEEIKC